MFVCVRVCVCVRPRVSERAWRTWCVSTRVRARSCAVLSTYVHAWACLVRCVCVRVRMDVHAFADVGMLAPVWLHARVDARCVGCACLRVCLHMCPLPCMRVWYMWLYIGLCAYLLCCVGVCSHACLHACVRSWLRGWSRVRAVGVGSRARVTMMPIAVDVNPLARSSSSPIVGSRVSALRSNFGVEKWSPFSKSYRHQQFRTVVYLHS